MDYDPEEIAGVFGRAAAAYDSVVPFFGRFGARLVKLADPRPGERIIDVGAGRGATLVPTAERVGPSGYVLGADLSREMVDLLAVGLADRRLAHAAARRMNAEALDVPSSSFDAAVCSFVLHVVPRPGAVAGEIRRALRPGGRLAASAPTGGGSRWDFLGDLLGQFWPRATRAVPVPFRPDFDLLQTLESCGFEVERSVDEEFEFVFADERAWWDWAWSSGIRGFFEVLPSPDLEVLRLELFAELAAIRESDGILMSQRAKLVVARKPR